MANHNRLSADLLTRDGDEPLVVFPDQTPTPPTLLRNDHLTFKGNREQGRHGWLRLTPAYSVHLVKDLIEHCAPDDLILDPFCGTGTTALVAAQAGRRCHTVDINPFLVWLANAKFATYSANEVNAARQAVQGLVEAILHNHNGSESLAAFWTPPIKDIHKWWGTETLHTLARLFAGIQCAPMVGRSRDLLLVSFCRVAIETASVSFGHQSMSFKAPKPDPSPYLLFAESAAERVANHLLRASADILRSAGEPVDVADARDGAPRYGQAFLGDARDLAASLPAPAARYTKVITSPPYPNRMSYIRELRPYMYWLGYLTSGRAAGELDWQAIGGTWGCATSNLARWEPTGGRHIPDPTFAETVARISQHSRLLGAYVAKYFYDATVHIQSLKGVLAPAATVQYIVGNSRFYDVTLSTERLYAAMLADQGFSAIHVEPIRKRTSKKDLFEFVVSATAP